MLKRFASATRTKFSTFLSALFALLDNQGFGGPSFPHAHRVRLSIFLRWGFVTRSYAPHGIAQAASSTLYDGASW